MLASLLLAAALATASPAETRTLVAEGLLPGDFARLQALGPERARAAARAGLKGPFSREYGEPAVMLKAARYAHGHPEFRRLLTTLRRGDLLLVSRNNPHHFIAMLTGGPYTHAMICTDPTPPGRFLEALGVTADPDDHEADRVRRGMGARLGDDLVTVRRMRPTDQLPPGQRGAAIERAIAFAEAQLGKPYNYVMSDRAGGDRAYYCSSYVYRAYQAAGVLWPIRKDPARDRLMLAVKDTMQALEPDDPLAASVAMMRFLHTHPDLGPAGLATYMVDELLPRARRTRHLVRGPAEREHLIGALTRLFEGKAFPPGQGPLALAGLLADSKIDSARGVAAFQALFGAAWPYADGYAALLTGRRSRATQGVARLLDALGAHAPWRVDLDFISPTDLAWAELPHEDFNVRAGTPPGPSWPYGLVPPDGRYVKLRAKR